MSDTLAVDFKKTILITGYRCRSILEFDTEDQTMKILGGFTYIGNVSTILIPRNNQ